MSLTVFVFPVYEEWLLRGVVANKLARRISPLGLVAVSGFLFGLLHLHQTGLRVQAVHMCLLGALAMAARLAGGSWVAGLVCHWVVNFLILLPKWSAAWIWLSAMGEDS